MKQRHQQRDLILIEAAQVWPFVETAKRLGADVSALAKRSSLPLDAVIKKEGLIGERSAWRFVGFAAQALRMDLLGHQVALDHPIKPTGVLGGMPIRMAPTPGRLLEFFIEDVTYQNNGARYQLVPAGDDIVFRREVIFPQTMGCWQTEQYVVTVIMQIIELCAGSSARPTKLGLSSSDKPLEIPEPWSNIEIEWGTDYTELAMSSEVFVRPIDNGFAAKEGVHTDRVKRPISTSDIHYLVDRQIWAGGPELERTAKELGISQSTLKRRLKENGHTFSEILETRRQFWAEQLLLETSKPISKIASTLGYGHAPNFSRAFKSKTGMSPRTFRARKKQKA